MKVEASCQSESVEILLEKVDVTMSLICNPQCMQTIDVIPADLQRIHRFERCPLLRIISDIRTLLLRGIDVQEVVVHVFETFTDRIHTG